MKLVKENSDDETSREKDGDFATLRSTDNIPDAFRAAVFALKQGEVSEPLKQPNGFYLLRAEEVTVRPLSEVRDEIYNDLKSARSDEWLRGMDRDAKVQIVNPAFISGTPAAARQEVALAQGCGASSALSAEGLQTHGPDRKKDRDTCGSTVSGDGSLVPAVPFPGSRRHRGHGRRQGRRDVPQQTGLSREVPAIL